MVNILLTLDFLVSRIEKPRLKTMGDRKQRPKIDLKNTITNTIPLSISKRLLIFKRCKIIKYFNQNTQSDKVYLLDNYIVCKRFKPNQKGLVLWKNELKTLMKLLHVDCVPTLVAYSTLEIYMTYCGKTISKSNLPKDWKSQIRDIFAQLRKVSVNPNDTLNKNICVLNDKIKIIDFGLANNNVFDLKNSYTQVIHNLSILK